MLDQVLEVQVCQQPGRNKCMFCLVWPASCRDPPQPHKTVAGRQPIRRVLRQRNEAVDLCLTRRRAVRHVGAWRYDPDVLAIPSGVSLPDLLDAGSPALLVCVLPRLLLPGA